MRGDMYETKDSGDHQEFPTGMVRSSQADKPRFDLMIRKDVPYSESMIYRRAVKMAQGAAIYGERNFELAETQEELDRFKASAFRHFMQWYFGEDDEDHAAALEFNVDAYEDLRTVLRLRESTEAVPALTEPHAELVRYEDGTVRVATNNAAATYDPEIGGFKTYGAWVGKTPWEVCDALPEVQARAWANELAGDGLCKCCLTYSQLSNLSFCAECRHGDGKCCSTSGYTDRTEQ
jgi:hypothetical protein